MQLGAHMSTSGGIHTAIDRVEAIGGDSVQIFTQSPRMWRPTEHDPANLARFRERRVETGLGSVICHAIYLVNLASPDDELYEKSVATLETTVDVACAIEADGVVFHVGSHLGAGFEAGLERAVPAIRRALERTARTRRGSCSRTPPARAGRSAARSTSSSRSSRPSTTRGSGSASTRATSGSPAWT